MKGTNVIVRGMVFLLAAVALLIIAGPVIAQEIEIGVSITPHHLSLSDGYIRFVRSQVSPLVPQGNPWAFSLAIEGEPDSAVSAIKVETHIALHDSMMVFFDCDEVRDMLAGETMGEVNLILSTFDAESNLYEGSDTIIVTD